MPHTPGPWRVVPPVGGEPAEILACPPGDDEGTLVASMETVNAADARLVAAAPDLLAAALAAREIVLRVCAEDSWPAADRARDLLDAAIRQAKEGARP